MSLRTACQRPRSILFSLALVLPACSGGGGAPAPPRTPEQIVYLSNDRLQLFAVNDNGAGTPVELTGGLGLEVLEFAVSPDRRAVAYALDAGSGLSDRLFVRELAQSASLEVMTTTNAFAEIADLQWSPDSSEIAYRADDMIDDRMELYRVPRAGGGAFRAYQTGQATIEVGAEFRWAPDSSAIALLSEQGGLPFRLQIHDVASGVEGAQTVETVGTDRAIFDLAYAPDGEWLAYRTDGSASLGQYEVFRVLADLSGSPVRSNGSVGGTASISGFSWSPSGDVLAQHVASYPGGSAVGVNVYDTLNEVSERIVTTSDIGRVAWSPVEDALAIVAAFVPGGGSTSDRSLLVYDVSTGLFETVNDPLASGEDVAERFAWGPGGQRLAYGIETASFQEDLYLAVLGGATPPVRVAGLDGHQGFAAEWAPGGQRLAVLELDVTQAFHPGRWHIVSAAGERLWSSAEVFTFDSSYRARWSSDGVRVSYSTASDPSGADALFSATPSVANPTALGATLSSTLRPFDSAKAQ